MTASQPKAPSCEPTLVLSGAQLRKHLGPSIQDVDRPIVPPDEEIDISKTLNVVAPRPRAIISPPSALHELSDKFCVVFGAIIIDDE